MHNTTATTPLKQYFKIRRRPNGTLHDWPAKAARPEKNNKEQEVIH